MQNVCRTGSIGQSPFAATVHRPFAYDPLILTISYYLSCISIWTPIFHSLAPLKHAINALSDSQTHGILHLFPPNTLLHRRMTEQERHALAIMRSSTSLRKPIVTSSVPTPYNIKKKSYVGDTSISSNLEHCFRFSENGTVFVATTLLNASQSLRVLRALPEKMPCVTRATISEAPCSRRVSAALARVPQVSGRLKN